MSDEFAARLIERGDYEKGYLELLSQLTEVGNISKWLFQKILDKMQQAECYKIFVIEDISRNRIIGCATLLIEQKFIHTCSSVGHIEDVVTDKEYRGRGLGKRITLLCVDYAKNYGCYKVELDCADHNVPFYEKCGFEKKENQMVIYSNRPKSKL